MQSLSEFEIFFIILLSNLTFASVEIYDGHLFQTSFGISNTMNVLD